MASITHNAASRLWSLIRKSFRVTDFESGTVVVGPHASASTLQEIQVTTEGQPKIVWLSLQVTGAAICGSDLSFTSNVQIVPNGFVFAIKPSANRLEVQWFALE